MYQLCLEHEAHSDPSDYSSTRGVSHDSVRGHRLWTGVKARGRRSTITAALVLPFLRRDRLRAATGTTKLPALKLPDGTVISHSRAILSWIADQK